MRAFRNVNLNIPGGMISLPVSIAKATDATSDPSPDVVGPEGEELKQVYVTADGFRQVERANTKRRFGDKIVTQDDLKAINEKCKIKDLDIIEVCDKSAVDFTLSQGKYFVYSHKKNGNSKAFNLFVQALKARNGAALVKWTPTSRQQLLALTVDSDGVLVANALPFGVDAKGTDDEVMAHLQAEVTEQELKLATQLLDLVAGDGSTLTSAVDEAVALKHELIQNGEVPEAEESEPKQSGADLMAQLQASLEQVKS